MAQSTDVKENPISILLVKLVASLYILQDLNDKTTNLKVKCKKCYYQVSLQNSERLIKKAGLKEMPPYQIYFSSGFGYLRKNELLLATVTFSKESLEQIMSNGVYIDRYNDHHNKHIFPENTKFNQKMSY